MLLVFTAIFTSLNTVQLTKHILLDTLGRGWKLGYQAMLLMLNQGLLYEQA